MTIWFNKKNNGKKDYFSKVFDVAFYPQHWKVLKCRTNGAIKGNLEHTCYDLTIWIFGLRFSYTNFDYNCDVRAKSKAVLNS